ncbi:MAG: Fe-S cluster assembly sulfur transfer protein SufU [Actinomycetota bacterium]
MSIDDLYKEVILDHYKNPRNKRDLPDATVSEHGNNPLCGDEITIHARLNAGTLAEITFEGQGCSISQASASMLTESVRGKETAEAEALARDFRGMMEGKAEPNEDTFGDLMALKGVVKYPVRIKCAVLGWDVLQDALANAGGAAS